MLSARVMAGGLCLFTVGCIAAPLDEGAELMGTEVHMATEAPIIVMNGDDPVFFWLPSTQQALRQLAQAPLEDATGEMASTPLLASVEGQRLLGYVARCTLPAGESLHSAAHGVSFQGGIGLAPQWAMAPLGGVAPQRWVTACLLQTLNGLGMRVGIRVSGSHPALAGGPGEGAAGYTVPDTTMFGNVLRAGEPAAFACVDTAILDACGPTWSIHTLERLCGLSPTCGLTLLGHCALPCNPDAAGNATCTGPGGVVYPEAISSSLKQTGFVALYGDCDG